jgi:RNA polymerase sigma factor (sigma-70 family)
MIRQEQDVAAISRLKTTTARAARACVRGSLAEDVAQELWLVAWQRLRDGLPEMSFVEMKHRAWDMLRRERRHEHESEEKARGVAAAEVSSSSVTGLCDVLEAIELTAAEQLVLIRRYWFGDHAKAIAERSGTTAEDVTATEHQALKKIAGELDRRLRDDR